MNQERLEVEEGSKRTISKRYLFVHSVGIKHFLFNVTKSPHHGQGSESSNFFGGKILVLGAGISYWRGRLSTVNLLVQTSLNKMLLIFKTLFTFVQKRCTCLLMKGRLSTVNFLIITSLDKMLLIFKTLFASLQNKLP